jgi:hypothetical protein
LFASGPNSGALISSGTGSTPGMAGLFGPSIRSPSMTAMSEIIHVTSVEVVGDHCLRLTFDDGASGEVDLSGWDWRGVFAPLADPVYFRQAAVDEGLGTVVWPNGADFAPETLHAWATRDETAIAT